MTHESTLLCGKKTWRLRGNKKTLMEFRGDLVRKDPKNYNTCSSRIENW
jgi:hypothetical protein